MDNPDTTERAPLPGRLVDRYGRPWIHGGTGYRVDSYGARPHDLALARVAGVPLVADGYGDLAPAAVPFDDLARRFGDCVPFRPVIHTDGADLDPVLAESDHDGLYHLLEGVTRAHVAATMVTPSNWPLIAAGRPGSWETVAMMEMVGVSVECIPPAVPHPAPARIAAIILSWIYGGDEYVEVAETIATAFGRALDERGGWHAGYYRTTGLDRVIGPRVLSWITSRAEHYIERCEEECSAA